MAHPYIARMPGDQETRENLFNIPYRGLAVTQKGIPDPRVKTCIPTRSLRLRIQRERCERSGCRNTGVSQWFDSWLCWKHRQQAMHHAKPPLLLLPISAIKTGT